jgi:hypothetical protein
LALLPSTKLTRSRWKKNFFNLFHLKLSKNISRKLKIKNNIKSHKVFFGERRFNFGERKLSVEKWFNFGERKVQFWRKTFGEQINHPNTLTTIQTSIPKH